MSEDKLIFVFRGSFKYTPLLTKKGGIRGLTLLQCKHRLKASAQVGWRSSQPGPIPQGVHRPQSVSKPYEFNFQTIEYEIYQSTRRSLFDAKMLGSTDFRLKEPHKICARKDKPWIQGFIISAANHVWISVYPKEKPVFWLGAVLSNPIHDLHFPFAEVKGMLKNIPKWESDPTIIVWSTQIQEFIIQDPQHKQNMKPKMQATFEKQHQIRMARRPSTIGVDKQADLTGILNIRIK